MKIGMGFSMKDKYVVHKKNLKIIDEQIVKLPKGCKILKVEAQYNDIAIWYAFETDNSRNLYDQTIKMVGTGISFSWLDSVEYIDTVQLNSGSLVIHVFKSNS